jgi:pyruvate/2-oxoglutarate dehydrogenase complex dihydrolipoamide dehydrogenase (E3) component/uncharacterized membrane protein YdjX (TVP38/TMEM64 family)
MKRWLVVAAILVLGLVAVLVFGIDERLTFDGLKNSRSALDALQEQAPLRFAAGFFALYVLVAAASLPGAAIMTIAAGALFGLVLGTVLVSFASTIGATLAFLVSRYVLRDVVERRFGRQLRTLNAGLDRDGPFYLLTLRLVPLLPFFVINLLMGLTRMAARTFYWVSQIGMLAGTLVYVNAGTQLAGIDSLAQVGSPRVLGAFVLLGAFPWIARAALRFMRKRRVYARWQRPRSFDRNLMVIGAGAAGLVSAYIGAALKAKVTLIEANKMGGDCLNYGCVPSKALIRSAKLAHQMRHADDYGLVPAEPRLDFKAVMARLLGIIRQIEPHDSVARYEELGVEVLLGHAKLLDPWTVEVALTAGEIRRLTARSIIIAAGARPFVPPLPGLDEVGYVTSDTLWDRLAQLDAPPRRVLVLGGGPIGCELAQALARLGSAVTQVEMLPRLMVREDQEVSALVQAVLERDGVTVLTGHEALRCERLADGKALVVASAGVQRRVEFDEFVCAVGRTPRLEGYGLEALGIPTNRTVLTNEYLETLYPNIFAAGDVAGPYQFTHVAGHQAWYAAVNALFGAVKRFKVDYSVVPWTTFVDPEVARVGLNEQDAAEQGIAYEVTRFDLAELDRAIADSATLGFVKVLTVPGKDRLLGVTVVGEHAGDLLAEYVLALKHGLGLNKILGTIHTYPTLAEANKYAAGEWRRAHAPQRLLAWAQRYHTWRRG